MLVNRETSLAVRERGQRLVSELGIGPGGSGVVVATPLVGVRLRPGEIKGMAMRVSRAARMGVLESTGGAVMLDPADPKTSLALLGAMDRGLEDHAGSAASTGSSEYHEFVKRSLDFIEKTARRGPANVGAGQGRTIQPNRGRYGGES